MGHKSVLIIEIFLHIKELRGSIPQHILLTNNYSQSQTRDVLLVVDEGSCRMNGLVSIYS